MEKKGLEFEVDMHILEEIVDKLNNYESDFLKKTAYLIGAITFRQPFFDGNKTTSLILGIHLLRQNGRDLPLDTAKQREGIFQILNDVMYAKKGYGDLEAYLRERVVSLS